MSSRSGEGPRRIPQQERGERRVAQLLGAAAAVIAANGYESTTMCGIAERADAPIGSLYQFFPNKPSIAQALRSHYVNDYEDRLIQLEAEAPKLSLQGLVTRLLKMTVEFLDDHPAFLALLDAPSSTRSPAALRKRLRTRLARCFIAVRPSLDKTRALRYAAVTLQMIKGLNQLYGEVSRVERKRIVGEYKVAISSYLSMQIGGGR